MNSLVPFDTSGNTVSGSPQFAATYTLSQTLAAGAMIAAFDLTKFNFQTPPSNIVPQIVRSSPSEAIIKPSARQWSATSFTCDLDSPTPDGTYVCSIQIYP